METRTTRGIGPTASGVLIRAFSAGAVALLALALASPARAAAPPARDDGVSIATIAEGVVSGSVDAGSLHSCGVRTDGTLACWGDNTFGQASPPTDTFTAVSAGGLHSCGLETDGTLACWGRNDLGQATPPAGTFTAVSAGGSHSCSLTTDGRLACWGDDGGGRASPPVGTFTAVSAGTFHSCGLRTDGRLACWGDDSEGQASSPVGTFSAVSAGTSHSCGLKTDGTLACWGSNAVGQTSPPAGTFTAVSAGANHSCGRRTDGTLACWGSNTFGKASPPAGSFSAVSAGDRHTCGLRTDGTLACWGADGFGEASPPTGTFSSRAVDAGGERHTCGLRTNGTLACWGDDRDGQASPPAGTFTAVSAGLFFGCGLRTEGTLACWGDNTFGQVSPPAGTFTAVSAGGGHGCGLKTDGTLACWGLNQSGEASPPAGTFTAVSAGVSYSCGVRTDGTLTCWGDNLYFQAPPSHSGSFTAVSAGWAHTCAVTTAGTADCWTDIPFQGGTFTAVSAGGRPWDCGPFTCRDGTYSCGVRTDGTLACWTARDEFGKASPPAGTFTAVSAGPSHSCGVRTVGTLACWGRDFGQLGAAPQMPGPAPPSPTFAGLAYSHRFTSSRGRPPGNFAVTAGSLPDGLSLSPDGVLSGTPTVAGSFDFTVTASNGLFPDASASFSITVTEDLSPPAITPHVTGTLGENGWYRSNVSVSWTVAEPESASTLRTSGCAPTTITSETSGTTVTCAATSAGGSASESVAIKRDTTAPSVTIFVPTATTYTQGQVVAAAYGCDDGGSGVGACTGPVAPGAPIDTATDGGKAFAVTAADRAGNTGIRSVDYTVAAAPPPPSPPPPPPPRPPASPPQRAPALLRLQALPLSVFGRGGSEARCAMRSGRIRACTVRLLAGGRVLAEGRAARAGARALTVRLRLTARGETLLGRRLGGLSATLRARAATSGGTRTGRARTRALLQVERFTTPRGSFLPGEVAFSERGKRFLASLRGRLVAVSALRCEGHSAQLQAPAVASGPTSLARAQLFCRALRKLGVRAKASVVGRGNAQPVASNATEAGRAENRRVDVTVRHGPRRLPSRADNGWDRTMPSSETTLAWGARR